MTRCPAHEANRRELLSRRSKSHDKLCSTVRVLINVNFYSYDDLLGSHGSRREAATLRSSEQRLNAARRKEIELQRVRRKVTNRNYMMVVRCKELSELDKQGCSLH